MESFRNLEDSSLYRPWWWVPILWIDPLRSMTGTWLLMHSFDFDQGDWSLVPKISYALTVGILFVAVLVQSLTRRGDGAMLAPMGYVAGLVAILLPLPVALIALPAAVAGLFAFGAFHAFFTVGLACTAVLGLVLGAKPYWLLPAIGVFLIPPLWSLLGGGALELPTRNKSGKA